MPNFEVTIGGRTITVVRPGQDNAGQRKQAFRDATDTMVVALAQGTHGLVTVDGGDADTDYYEVPRGQHNGTWVEQKTARVRPAQVQQAQVEAKGAESGIVARPGAEPAKENVA